MSSKEYFLEHLNNNFAATCPTGIAVTPFFPQNRP